MELSPTTGSNGSTAVRMDPYSPLRQSNLVDSGHCSPIAVQVLDLLLGLCGREHLRGELPLLLKLRLRLGLLKLWLRLGLLILRLWLRLLILRLRLGLLILRLFFGLLVLRLRLGLLILGLRLRLLVLRLRLGLLILGLWLRLLVLRLRLGLLGLRLCLLVFRSGLLRMALSLFMFLHLRLITLLGFTLCRRRMFLLFFLLLALRGPNDYGPNQQNQKDKLLPQDIMTSFAWIHGDPLENSQRTRAG